MELVDMLKIIALGMGFLIIILMFIYWMLSRKSTTKNKVANERVEVVHNENLMKKSNKDYTRIPVTDFLEFDKIEDNMIIQNKTQRYLMAVECEGINYDLMSGVEKASVEEGFLQFLNILRHPIQIYVQTRTINVNQSIETYTEKISEVKKELEEKSKEYNDLLQNHSQYTDKLKSTKMELVRLQNLYEYGKDIVTNIEKMNFNKNVLRKFYYIIVPCYLSEISNEEMNNEEKRNIMFSELYTRAQGIVRALSACSVKSKILNSDQIVELLYNAYNRDESEVNTWDKVIKSGYQELYSTAPDVLDKKIMALNEEIQEKAMKKAVETVSEVRVEKQKQIKKITENVDNLVAKLAQGIIKENEKYIGEEFTNEAIDKLDKEITNRAIEKVNKKWKEDKNVKDKRKTKSVTK